MPGPPPTPTAILKSRAIGNRTAGHRPLNLSEPTGKVGEPEMPSWLPAAARAHWKRLVPILLDMGVLTVADGETLACYCEAFTTWVASIKVLHRKKSTADEKKIARQERNEAYKVIAQVGARFGLSPADRSRIHVAAPKKEEDPLEKLLKRNPAGGVPLGRTN